MKISHQDILQLIEQQLEVWPLARKNYGALMECMRRPFTIGDLSGAWQCNPQRKLSTGANLQEVAEGKRPCFLCSSNRPPEQISIPFGEDWEILVNPYPIFPVHLTIVSREHKPQDAVPLEIVSLAETLEDMAVFFNGAEAGASAPDHLHLQAVLKEELPIIKLIEENHSASESEVALASGLGLELPFEAISCVIYPDTVGMSILNAVCNEKDGKRNVFAWLDSNSVMRLLIIPRSAHRPECFYRKDDERLMVSPGAIDMAGVMILPRKEDFERITVEKTKEIYSQTGIPIGHPER